MCYIVTRCNICPISLFMFRCRVMTITLTPVHSIWVMSMDFELTSGNNNALKNKKDFLSMFHLN